MPQAGFEPMSLALKGGFLTTGPPAKSLGLGILTSLKQLIEQLVLPTP